MEIHPPNYDKVELDLWRKHGSEVLNLLNENDTGLIRRIRTFCERFGFEEKDVCQKLKMISCLLAVLQRILQELNFMRKKQKISSYVPKLDSYV